MLFLKNDTPSPNSQIHTHVGLCIPFLQSIFKAWFLISSHCHLPFPAVIFTDAFRQWFPVSYFHLCLPFHSGHWALNPSFLIPGREIVSYLCFRIFVGIIPKWCKSCWLELRGSTNVSCHDFWLLYARAWTLISKAPMTSNAHLWKWNHFWRTELSKAKAFSGQGSNARRRFETRRTGTLNQLLLILEGTIIFSYCKPSPFHWACTFAKHITLKKKLKAPLYSVINWTCLDQYRRNKITTLLYVCVIKYMIKIFIIQMWQRIIC